MLIKLNDKETVTVQANHTDTKTTKSFTIVNYNGNIGLREFNELKKEDISHTKRELQNNIRQLINELNTRKQTKDELESIIRLTSWISMDVTKLQILNARKSY